MYVGKGKWSAITAVVYISLFFVYVDVRGSDTLVTYALSIMCSLILSWCLLSKSPVLLVHLSCYQPVSRDAYPIILSAKEGSHYYTLYSIWYDPTWDGPRDFSHPRRTLYNYTTEAVLRALIIERLLRRDSPVGS